MGVCCQHPEGRERTLLPSASSELDATIESACRSEAHSIRRCAADEQAASSVRFNLRARPVHGLFAVVRALSRLPRIRARTGSRGAGQNNSPKPTFQAGERFRCRSWSLPQSPSRRAQVSTTHIMASNFCARSPFDDFGEHPWDGSSSPSRKSPPIRSSKSSHALTIDNNKCR